MQPTKLRPLFRSPYTCSQCLSRAHRPRNFSASRRTLNGSAPSPPPPSGYTELTTRSLLSLSGTDAAKFLQGLTTNNVDPARHEGWYSGFLNAKGRVLYDVFIYPYTPVGDNTLSYLIEVDATQAKAFRKHLSRHKLRSDVAIRDVQDEWRIWSVWQDTEASKSVTPEDAQYTDSSLTMAQRIMLADPRQPKLGHRVVLGADQGTPSQAFTRYEKLKEEPLTSYTLRRYLNGIPESQGEIIQEAALPLESNMDYMDGIDFRKGCYVGQELTIRTQHTGVVRKRILPVQLYTASAPSALCYEPRDPVALSEVPQGVDIMAEGGKRPSGKLLKSVGNVGLALCRLENMTDMKVSAEGGTFSEGLEFALKGSNVKVKAFVPDWLRAREEEKLLKRGKREENLAAD